MYIYIFFDVINDLVKIFNFLEILELKKHLENIGDIHTSNNLALV